MVPAFFIREKEVNLPKIRNSHALVEAELDKREVVIEESDEQISNQNSRKSHLRETFNNGGN